MPGRGRALSGARESNAGDDFHALWAARRALRLLDRLSGLQRIAVEGVTPLEEVDSDDEGFLGVDLTEYLGGDSFPEADRVITTQLKYSTRNPNRAWTASRITSGDSRSAKGASVVKRLADVYKTFSDKHGRTEVVRKLRVRLVSNQPLEDTLHAALTVGQSVLTEKGTVEVRSADLCKHLPAHLVDVLKRMYRGSKLRSVEFTDFLRVLDLSGCGEEGRIRQRIRLIQELAPSVIDDPVQSLLELKNLIEYEALPEAKESPGLTKSDVLAALGVGSEEALFPAPSDLRSTPRKIETAEAPSLAAMVIGESERRRILVHGDAGVGKTTTVQAMQEHLPTGSVTVLYDCYGGGEYLVAGEQRHTNMRAFQQLINDLAVSCSTPFLVRAEGEVSDIQRRYSKTLDAAAKIAGEEGGLLVIVVDAADNAMFAARQQGDACFVPPIWTVALPDNARLLVTSRSHRCDELNAPENVTEYELRGFNEEASSRHLRRVFPEADDSQCRVFHERTAGNPRLQFYLLERVEHDGDTAQTLDDVLTAKERFTDDIFEDLLDAAIEHAPDPHSARQLAAALVCLSRPTSVDVFADACGIPLEKACNFCRALVPGLVVEDDAARFRDEDFESYLRGRVGDAALKAAEDRLGGHFLSRADLDPYAARFAANHLFAAGRHEDVITLALEGPEPSAIEDSILRLRVCRDRTTLAMRSASAANREKEAVRLVLLAAELARSDEATNAVIMEEPGLAAIHGNPNDVARLYLRDDDKPWLGPAHFEIAAMYSREASYRSRVDEQLDMALAWVRRRQALPDHETFGWFLNAEDVAAGAEAIYRLHGAERTRDWLMEWWPRRFRLDAAYALVKELAAREDVPRLEKELAELGLPALVEAALLAAIFAGGHLPSRYFVEEVADRLDRAGSKRRAHSRLGAEWAAKFCELHAVHGLNPERTLRLLQTFALPIPNHVPAEYDDLSGYDAPLRMLCLRAALEGRELTIDELIPERYRKKQNADPHRYDPNESERRDFRDIVGKVLGAYKLRAKALAQELTVAEAREELEVELSGRRSASEYRWHKFDWRYKGWARNASEALISAEGDAEPYLLEIADLAERMVKTQAPGLWIDLAERTLKSPAYRYLGYQLIERAAQTVTEERRPGRERWQTLLRCASVVDRYDAELGRDLYLRAVRAAEKLDDENALLLGLHASCARRAASDFCNEQRKDLALRMARSVEMLEGYVSEPSVLPWEETLGAVTALDPASGLALCSRWDDEDRLLLRSGVVPVVHTATEMRYLQPEQGLHLLRLAGERFDISTDALSLMERLLAMGSSARPRLAEMMREVSDWIRRDVLPEQRERAASRVVAWADANRVGGLSGVAELRRILLYLEPLSGRDEGISSYASTIAADPEYKARRRKEVEAEDKASKAALRAAVADAQLGKFDDLLDRYDVYRRGSYRPSREDDPDFFDEVQKAVPPGGRERYLDALVDLGDDFLTVRSLVRGVAVLALDRALDAWRGSSVAISWTTQGVGGLLRRHLPDIVTRDYNARDNLRAILSKADLAATPTSLLLPAVADHAEALDTRALYDIADVLITDLTPAKQGEVFDWSIRRVEVMVARDEGSLPELPPKQDPVGASAALASLLWAAFGHPWKPVRWRAAHAARALLRLPTPALLRALIDLSKSKTAGAFRAEHLEFFWMSARAWLLVVLERLADERPDTVRAEIGSIIDHALTPDLPHAQIRELAKRIALRLAEHDPGALSEGMVEKLRLSNEPSECLYPRRSSYSLRLGNRLNDNGEERVGFDDMDTVPYWFTPLGRVFAQGPRVVADKAGRWIVDRWGRTSADWWNDPRELRRERLAGFFMNRQGSIPRAESLRLYLFYQSMQCVAGEMVDELPMLVEEYDDECPWTDWLEEHLPTSQDFWLADLRSPTPFRQESWGYYPPLEEWLRREDPAEFEAALGIGEPGHDGEIVLDGYVEDWDRERRGTMKVMSALVSPETSTSLLHALQTSDPHNFRLPYEGERLDNGASEKSEPGFVLEGLITEWRRERRYLDEHDPLTRGIKGYLPQLGRNFLQVLGLSASEDLLTYSRPDGETVAHLEVWSDNPEERDYITKAFSTGERLWVRTEVLLDYLRRRGMDLVIEAQIVRNVERRHGRRNQIEEREYDLGESTIYILRRDGSLETMAGRRALGTPHST